MEKFIDDPAELVDDLLEGLALVMADYVNVIGHTVVRKGLQDEAPKVTSVTMGGAGHEPSSLGFLGRGWECVKVIGDIFAAPSAVAVADAIRLANKGRGVLLYVGNHDGDVLSAKLALKLLKRDGIPVELVILRDDISFFDRAHRQDRRGMAGSLILGRVIGAACESGYSLQEVKRVAEDCVTRTATLSAASRGATHPVNGFPISHITPGKMVIGMGQHGEGQGREEPMQPAREVIRRMADRLCADLELQAGDKVSVTLYGTGSTTYMELLVLYRDTVEYFQARGITISATLVGEYLTTQEQAGFQLSCMKLNEELRTLLDAPCHTFFVHRG